MAELLDEYLSVAGWDVSTEETNLGYIRRTIKPALGSKEVRKVRGPLLDNLYARLQKCGSPACAGKPFTEHRHVPDPTLLTSDPSWASLVRTGAAPKFSVARMPDRPRLARRGAQAAPRSRREQRSRSGRGSPGWCGTWIPGGCCTSMAGYGLSMST